jgi:hypothetical protein
MPVAALCATANDPSANSEPIQQRVYTFGANVQKILGQKEDESCEWCRKTGWTRAIRPFRVCVGQVAVVVFCGVVTVLKAVQARVLDSDKPVI